MGTFQWSLAVGLLRVMVPSEEDEDDGGDEQNLHSSEDGDRIAEAMAEANGEGCGVGGGIGLGGSCTANLA